MFVPGEYTMAPQELASLQQEQAPVPSLYTAKKGAGPTSSLQMDAHASRDGWVESLRPVVSARRRASVAPEKAWFSAKSTVPAGPGAGVGQGAILVFLGVGSLTLALAAGAALRHWMVEPDIW